MYLCCATQLSCCPLHHPSNHPPCWPFPSPLPLCPVVRAPPPPLPPAAHHPTHTTPQANKLREVIANALFTYRQHKDSYLALMKRGMEQDLSWDNAAQQYEEVLVAAKYQW